MKYKNITGNEDFDVVILADGDFPTARIPLDILHRAKHLICCDGAGKYLLEHSSLVPEAIVGDGDSLPAAFKERYANLFHHVEEQDDNDLTKATRFALSHSDTRPLHIAYLGATGKREDHMLGNISLMARYRMELGVEPIMLTNYGCFNPLFGHCCIETFKGEQISIFNISCHRLEGKGFRWNPYTYSMLWQGTLNEAVGTEVELNGDGAYMVYRTYEAKHPAL